MSTRTVSVVSGMYLGYHDARSKGGGAGNRPPPIPISDIVRREHATGVVLGGVFVVESGIDWFAVVERER